MKTKIFLTLALSACALSLFAAGEFDSALLRGSTDKDIPFYEPGQEMVFTIEMTGLTNSVPAGEWFVKWERTGDDGKSFGGKVPVPMAEPLVVKTSLDQPGFVRVKAVVVDKAGKNYTRTNPKLKWESKTVFFDGSAGVHPEKLQSEPEPKDFDAFWAKQRERLAKVPVTATCIELPCGNPKAKLWAVEIPCAGVRPVTGYLTIPKASEEGKKYPCVLETHGYSYRAPHNPPGGAREDEIVLNINAHGMKLPAFGADDGYYKALGWEIKSNGKSYAFDPEQNKDPEVAYFNGMVLRVMRALQYLKTLPEWNGKDLRARGGSQGGLQTIWAAGCGEGVTQADSGITWCCDMANNTRRLERKMASDGWYIPWTPALGYYDPVNVAKRIPRTCMTTITRAGLGDYCCPPRGLAILYNNMTCPKKINWVQGSTHGYVPPEPNQKFSLEAK